MPDFEVPPPKLFSVVFVDSCVIALVTYSITMSLALLVSEKLKYKLDTNQELLAQGISNVIGSFFSCLPCGASPSRSASQMTVGGKTQMASIVSAAIVVVVLLWIGVIFEPLPRCVLSSIVVVALKGIMFQVSDLPKIWRDSKYEGTVWIVTYATVIVLDIDTGLLVGISVSLLTVFVRGVLNDVHELGRLPDTDLYVPLDLYGDAAGIPDIKIIRYAGSLNVINRYMFKRKVIAAVGADRGTTPVTVAVIDGKRAADHSGGCCSRAPCLILDMAALQYTDASGFKILQELIESLASDSYEVYLVAVPENSLKYIRGNGLKCVRFFPTVHDAVVFRQFDSRSKAPIGS